jgi:hypothetical protein
MPNWCNNHIKIRGTNQAEIQLLAAAFEKGEFCNAVIPTPEDLDITAGRLGADDSPEQIALVEAEQRNLEKYGVKNWYDFQVSRWGTKWDVGGSEFPLDRDEDGLGFSASFDSAWSPPMGVVEELVNRGMSVTLYYYEPGCAYVGKYEDGYDECLDFGGCDSKTVRDYIGEELDDMWGISESMAEYEAENMDEFQEWYEDGVDKLKEKNNV